jgi:hypothetical protein
LPSYLHLKVFVMATPEPPTLLSLSDELLSQICSFAMVHQPASPPLQSPSKLLLSPPGIITSQISKTLRILLRPFRAHPRLYRLARYSFLDSNLTQLNLLDIRMSASRLEAPPPPAQMIMTGNPDPLLKSLVHVQLSVSVSDMRAPYTRGSAFTWAERQPEKGVAGDVLGLEREAMNLARLGELCPGLRTLHLFLKVDEWLVYGKGPDLRARVRGEDGTVVEREMSVVEWRYRKHAEAMVEMVRKVKGVKVVTVGFHHWNGGGKVLGMEEASVSDVVEAMLVGDIDEIWEGPMIRVR